MTVRDIHAIPWRVARFSCHNHWSHTQWQKQGYSLEYRVRNKYYIPDTGWYLYGSHGHQLGFMAKHLDVAKENADEFIARRNQCRQL